MPSKKPPVDPLELFNPGAHKREYKKTCTACGKPKHGRRKFIGSECVSCAIKSTPPLMAQPDAVDTFTKMRGILDEIERAERDSLKPTREERLRDYRHDRRRERLPRDLRCKLCGEVKIESRQFIVYAFADLLGTGLTALVPCVSCARKHGYPKRIRRRR